MSLGEEHPWGKQQADTAGQETYTKLNRLNHSHTHIRETASRVHTHTHTHTHTPTQDSFESSGQHFRVVYVSITRRHVHTHTHKTPLHSTWGGSGQRCEARTDDL